MQKNSKILSALALSLLALVLAPGFAAAADGKVNINKADAGDLALLPRVGAVVAERIIEFREQNGEFAATEDLMLVKGIGERTFELMEPYLAVEGETTLTEKVRTSSASKSDASEEQRS